MYSTSLKGDSPVLKSLTFGQGSTSTKKAEKKVSTGVSVPVVALMMNSCTPGLYVYISLVLKENEPVDQMKLTGSASHRTSESLPFTDTHSYQI